jgi:hypothetical protein
MISGLNGTNCITTAIARTRVESNIITSALIIGTKNDFKVCFDNDAAQWNGQNLYLSRSRQPFEPRIFKTIDGAMSEIIRVGLNTAVVRVGN